MAYLYVALVERLLKGQKTLFQIGDLIYAISDTVQLDAKYRHFRDFAGEDRDIVGLVDAQRPRANIMLSRVILTSSANDPESRKWLSQLPSPIEGDVYLMDCWSYEELALAAFVHLYFKLLVCADNFYHVQNFPSSLRPYLSTPQRLR